MTRNTILIGATIPIAIFLVSGCTIPLRVERVTDRNTPTEGVRYLLKRPSYAVSLRHVPQDEANPNSTVCDFEVLVSQSLTGTPIEFEAIGETEVFADTEIALLQDSDAALSGFTAGATDRSVEALQTLASIATTVAAPRTQDGPPIAPSPPCHDEELNAYVAEHRKLIDDTERARRAAQHQIDHVTEGSGSAKVRNIRELEGLVATRMALVDAHVFPLSPERAHVKLVVDDGSGIPERLIQGTGAKPWITIKLTPVAP
jgi:hypothetical protein